MIRFVFISLLLISPVIAFAQAERLNNASVLEMSRAGLSAEIIRKKIATSPTTFDISSQSLIDLKKSGVDDSIISLMIDRNNISLPGEPEKAVPLPLPAAEKPRAAATLEQAVGVAKTIAFGKSSRHPNIQALEKELMKRQEFQALNLSIMRYGDRADLHVDIEFVSGSWITHRYVYRIYDRRSGAVVGGGETTSWGSLAENLARNIAKTLRSASTGKSKA